MKIAIIGAGGLGKEMAAALKAQEDYDFQGFFDDDTSKKNQLKDEYLGPIKDIASTDIFSANEQERARLLIAIGSPSEKKHITEQLLDLGLSYARFIHPKAHLEDQKAIVIGSGTAICSGTQMTTDIKIGDHVIINLNCTIGHDVIIHDFCSLMPGCHISGNVQMGKGVFVGSGAVILPNLSIGEDAVIGAGAVVTKDVKQGATIVGVPGKAK